MEEDRIMSTDMERVREYFIANRQTWVEEFSLE
jgi:1,4-alpha-glucan branching enzyme